MAVDFNQSASFFSRHIGPDQAEIEQMLQTLDFGSLEELVERAVPKSIRLKGRLRLPDRVSESQLIRPLRDIASANRVSKPLLGMGYSDCITPPVSLRTRLQHPSSYPARKPCQ